MEAIKKSNSVVFWIVVGFLFVAAGLGVLVSLAQAETVKFRVNHYLTQLETIPAGDVEGHKLNVYSRRGVAFFENGEVAAYTTWGTSDYIQKRGSFQGYSLITHADGSTTVQKYQGTVEPAPDGKAGILKYTGEYIQGTGRFQGIKGTLSGIGKTITPPSPGLKETRGDISVDFTATYTLPPKK